MKETKKYIINITEYIQSNTINDEADFENLKMTTDRDIDLAIKNDFYQLKLDDNGKPNGNPVIPIPILIPIPIVHNPNISQLAYIDTQPPAGKTVDQLWDEYIAGL